MPADILPIAHLRALDRLAELNEVAEARDGTAALFLLIREAIGTRLKTAESALRCP